MRDAFRGLAALRPLAHPCSTRPEDFILQAQRARDLRIRRTPLFAGRVGCDLPVLPILHLPFHQNRKKPSRSCGGMVRGIALFCLVGRTPGYALSTWSKWHAIDRMIAFSWPGCCDLAAAGGRRGRSARRRGRRALGFQGDGGARPVAAESQGVFAIRTGIPLRGSSTERRCRYWQFSPRHISRSIRPVRARPTPASGRPRNRARPPASRRDLACRRSDAGRPSPVRY